MINLQEFLDGYKKSEVELGENKRVFREPKIRDINLPVMKMLEKNCLEGRRDEFQEVLKELPIEKHKQLIENILKDLGLA